MGISFICRGEVQLLDGDALGLGGLAPGHSDAEEAVGVLGLGLGSVGIFGQTDDAAESARETLLIVESPFFWYGGSRSFAIDRQHPAIHLNVEGFGIDAGSLKIEKIGFWGGAQGEGWESFPDASNIARTAEELIHFLLKPIHLGEELGKCIENHCKTSERKLEPSLGEREGLGIQPFSELKDGNQDASLRREVEGRYFRKRVSASDSGSLVLSMVWPVDAGE
jgi:hypothetical protein